MTILSPLISLLYFVCPPVSCACPAPLPLFASYMAGHPGLGDSRPDLPRQGSAGGRRGWRREIWQQNPAMWLKIHARPGRPGAGVKGVLAVRWAAWTFFARQWSAMDLFTTDLNCTNLRQSPRGRLCGQSPECLPVSEPNARCTPGRGAARHHHHSCRRQLPVPQLRPCPQSLL